MEHWEQRLPWQLIPTAASITLLVIVTGCGGADLAKVSGKVTYKNEPLGGGRITFTNPARGISIKADLAPDGRYLISTAKGVGLPPGEYQIAIFPPSDPIPLDPGALGKSAKPKNLIPSKYSDEKTSGLAAIVQPGNNDFSFDLRE